MKNILIIAGLILLVAAGSIWAWRSNHPSDLTGGQQNTIINTPADNQLTQNGATQSEINDLTITDLGGEPYGQWSDPSSIWSQRLAKFYDLKTIFDMGNPTKLSDGSYLIGVSIVEGGNVDMYLEMDRKGIEWGQKIVWLDSQFNKIKSTIGIREETIVAPIAPTIKSLRDGLLTFSFDSGDAGVSCSLSYELKLATFEWSRLQGGCQEVL